MTISVPSGEKLTLVILFEWPFKGFPILIPVYASHIMANSSQLPVTILVPSGEKLKLLILSEWPYNSSTNEDSVFAFQIMLPVAISVLFGENLTLKTGF